MPGRKLVEKHWVRTQKWIVHVVGQPANNLRKSPSYAANTKPQTRCERDSFDTVVALRAGKPSQKPSWLNETFYLEEIQSKLRGPLFLTRTPLEYALDAALHTRDTAMRFLSSSRCGRLRVIGRYLFNLDLVRPVHHYFSGVQRSSIGFVYRGALLYPQR
jgi:hypothetical protein